MSDATAAEPTQPTESADPADDMVVQVTDVAPVDPSEPGEPGESAEVPAEAGAESGTEAEAPAEPPLDARVSELEAALEEARAARDEALARIQTMETDAAKADALSAVGLDPATYGRFLSGPAEGWQDQISALTALRGQESPAPSVPRDPAVDADPSPAESREALARAFFGID